MKRQLRDCKNCFNNTRTLCPDWEKPEHKPAPFCDSFKERIPMKQEQQVKELAGEIFKLMHPGDKFRIGNNRTDYLISLAQHLISKGWRKAGELTVSERKTTSDGQELLLYRLTRKEVLSIPLKVRQGIIERQVNNYFANLSDDEKLEELKRYCDLIGL